jgi:hypothetical protein
LGPTILALNYRLFKGHVADLNADNSSYAGLYRSKFRPYLDAQFDHTHQLNALIIAWGAFAFEIINAPLERLTKLADTIQIIVNQDHISCQNVCLNSTVYKYGDAVNDFIDLASHNLISLLIVSLAFGFVIWAFVRLISGELSTPDIMKLYEKKNQTSFSLPPFASRITLYRYIFVSFTFLYLTWTRCYLTFRARGFFIEKCNFNTSDKEIINKETDRILGLPGHDATIYLIILIVILLITIFIMAYYRAEFIYKLRTIKKSLRQ